MYVQHIYTHMPAHTHTHFIDSESKVTEAIADVQMGRGNESLGAEKSQCAPPEGKSCGGRGPFVDNTGQVDPEDQNCRCNFSRIGVGLGEAESNRTECLAF